MGESENGRKWKTMTSKQDSAKYTFKKNSYKIDYQNDGSEYGVPDA